METVKKVIRFMLSLKWMAAYVYVASAWELIVGSIYPVFRQISLWCVVIFGTFLIIGFAGTWANGGKISDVFKE